MTLAHTKDLYFTEGDGINDGRIGVWGTVNAINAALDGLVFQPFTDFSGQARITIVSNDLGHTGTGHIKMDGASGEDYVAITVTGTQDCCAHK